MSTLFFYFFHFMDFAYFLFKIRNSNVHIIQHPGININAIFLKALKIGLFDGIILCGMSGIVWMFAWRRQQTSRAHKALAPIEGGNDMAFFSKLGETITETSKDVSQKAKELTELAKLNMSVKKKEEFVQKQYLEIGKQYFDLHKDDEEPFFEEISVIKEKQQEILQLEMEIAAIKGQKKCPNCGILLEQDSVFCRKCGAKYEDIFVTEPEAEEGQDACSEAEACAQEATCGTEDAVTEIETEIISGSDEPKETDSL